MVLTRINDHCFFPPLAGLFTFILDTSQMIVKFYCQTLWPQSFTSHVMRYELNLELDNSRDKPDKKTSFTVSQRCITLKTQVEVRKKASMNNLA